MAHLSPVVVASADPPAPRPAPRRAALRALAGPAEPNDERVRSAEMDGLSVPDSTASASP